MPSATTRRGTSTARVPGAARHSPSGRDLGLIGMAIEQRGVQDGDEFIVELDAWEIGNALEAADDMDLLRASHHRPIEMIRPIRSRALGVGELRAGEPPISDRDHPLLAAWTPGQPRCRQTKVFTISSEAFGLTTGWPSADTKGCSLPSTSALASVTPCSV